MTFEEHENVDICLCIIAQYRQFHILGFTQAILSLNIGVSIDIISILYLTL